MTNTTVSSSNDLQMRLNVAIWKLFL